MGFPEVLLLRGGTMNIIATSLGVEGSPETDQQIHDTAVAGKPEKNMGEDENNNSKLMQSLLILATSDWVLRAP